MHDANVPLGVCRECVALAAISALQHAVRSSIAELLLAAVVAVAADDMKICRPAFFPSMSRSFAVIVVCPRGRVFAAADCSLACLPLCGDRFLLLLLPPAKKVLPHAASAATLRGAPVVLHRAGRAEAATRRQVPHSLLQDRGCAPAPVRACVRECVRE